MLCLIFLLNRVYINPDIKAISLQSDFMVKIIRSICSYECYRKTTVEFVESKPSSRLFSQLAEALIFHVNVNGCQMDLVQKEVEMMVNMTHELTQFFEKT